MCQSSNLGGHGRILLAVDVCTKNKHALRSNRTQNAKEPRPCCWDGMRRLAAGEARDCLTSWVLSRGQPSSLGEGCFK